MGCRGESERSERDNKFKDSLFLCPQGERERERQITRLLFTTILHTSVVLHFIKQFVFLKSGKAKEQAGDWWFQTSLPVNTHCLLTS